MAKLQHFQAKEITFLEFMAHMETGKYKSDE